MATTAIPHGRATAPSAGERGPASLRWTDGIMGERGIHSADKIRGCGLSLKQTKVCVVPVCVHILITKIYIFNHLETRELPVNYL